MNMAPSLDELATFLSRRLQGALPGPDAQRRFAPRPLIDHWSPEQTPPTARRAAVLLLIYPGQTGPMVPLTLRPATLPTHAGQISLPGGALHADESAEAAALREAEEELGVEPASVQVVGELSTLWVAVSNFVITPVVGLTRNPPPFSLHPPEVDALIEMPLDRLVDRATLRWAHRERLGIRLDYPYFDIDGHAVWGATAMILGEFACLFEPGHAPGPREDQR
jgi:8-oxo-dGTP pyrophosphatase MutT (NUDIX family)